MMETGVPIILRDDDDDAFGPQRINILRKYGVRLWTLMIIGTALAECNSSFSIDKQQDIRYSIQLIDCCIAD